MNQTGCLPGFATDTILFYSNVPQSCDMSVSAYIAFASLINLGKLFVALGHSYLWLRRAGNLKAKQTAKKLNDRRIPIVPLLSWLSMITYILFFVFTGTDNSFKGEANFLFGFGWLIFGILSLVYLLKFVSLGHRMVPKNHLKLFAKVGEKLSKLNLSGKVGVFFCLLTLVGQTLTMCVVGLLFPQAYVVIRIANAFTFV